MKRWLAIIAGLLAAGALAGCGADDPAWNVEGVKYRGVFVYPWQQGHAQAAAGCKTEMEFAKVASTDLKENYGANTVVVVGGPEPPKYLEGTGTYEEIVRAYVAEGMYVLLYTQGEFYFRGREASNWTDQDLAEKLVRYRAYLKRFEDISDHIIGTCVVEEIETCDYRNGRYIEEVIHPRLRQYWKGIKQMEPWPVFVILGGSQGGCTMIANLPDDERPDVCMVETYESLYTDGVPQNGTPALSALKSGEYDPGPMIEAARQKLDTARRVLAGKCVMGHVPLIGGLPLELVTGKGWEFVLATKFCRPQIELYGGKYQLGWSYVTGSDIHYLHLRDEKYRVTAIGEALKDCWKESGKPAVESGKQ